MRRLLNLASTLDCWVTIYPSLKGLPQGEDLQFFFEVTDENDFVRARVINKDLEGGASAAITVLQDGIQKGGFD